MKKLTALALLGLVSSTIKSEPFLKRLNGISGELRTAARMVFPEAEKNAGNLAGTVDHLLNLHAKKPYLKNEVTAEGFVKIDEMTSSEIKDHKFVRQIEKRAQIKNQQVTDMVKRDLKKLALNHVVRPFHTLYSQNLDTVTAAVLLGTSYLLRCPTSFSSFFKSK